MDELKTVFDAVMAEKLKGLKSGQCLTHSADGFKWEFIPAEVGGCSEWFTSVDVRYYNNHHHTLPDILDALWAVCKDVDGWVIADGAASIYDEDTQPIETVHADYEAFKIFIVPRLARMKDMPALVLIAPTYPPALLVVGIDGDKWYLLGENPDGSQNSISIWNTMQGVMEKMWEWRAVLSSPVAWQMRQQTMGGRFDTIFTQEWNQYERN